MQASRGPDNNAVALQSPYAHSPDTDATMDQHAAQEVPPDSQGGSKPLAVLSPLRRKTTPDPLPTLSYQAPAHNGASSGSHEKYEPTSDNHVQFAIYPNESERPMKAVGLPPSPSAREVESFTPQPLQAFVWVPLVVFLVAAAIALEVTLHFNEKNLGFSSGSYGQGSSALHYAYTLPPVIVCAVIVGVWAWTSIEIKRMQPYVDLVHGDSPPHRSLLLDYTRDNNFLVWTRAAANRHYIVALASLMGLLCLSFQPLASALLEVRETWIQLPDYFTTNLAQIGLNQNSQFNDLSSFLSGAGYAGASVMYELPPPPFIKVPYTVAPFELPSPLVTTNGTAIVNTTAVKSATGCQSATVQMTSLPGSAWQNTASLNGCTFNFGVAKTSEILFGVDIPTCTQAVPEQFSPVVFWFFSYGSIPTASVTFCSPTFTLWEVMAAVDSRTGNVTAVTETRPFTSASPFAATSANVTGTPLNGRAYNGIAFNLVNPDQFVLARQNATRLQLPASVYQAALKMPVGSTGVYTNDTFTPLVDNIYGTYLTLVAKEVYFLPDSERLNVQVRTFQPRVWLSRPAVHLLAIGFLLLALFGAIVHIFHREDRRFLRLTHAPGTIASAVSLGAHTELGDVLAGRHAEADLRSALADKRFRMNPDTMRIIMDTEEDYEVPDAEPSAQFAPSRRMSMVDRLQGRRMSRRFSVGQPGLPTSPRSPHTPRTPRTPRTPNTPPAKSPDSSSDNSDPPV